MCFRKRLADLRERPAGRDEEAVLAHGDAEVAGFADVRTASGIFLIDRVVGAVLLTVVLDDDPRPWVQHVDPGHPLSLAVSNVHVQPRFGQTRATNEKPQ